MAENEPTVPHSRLTATFVRSIRIEPQAQKNGDYNFFVIGPITSGDCIAVSGIVNQIGATLTVNSLKIRKFGKDSKHVIWAFPIETSKAPCPLLCERASQHGLSETELLETYPTQLVTLSI